MSRDELIDGLSAIQRIRVSWPNIEIREFTPEEDVRFRSWVGPLSDAELAEELVKGREDWLRRNEAEIARGAQAADEAPLDVTFR